MKSTFLSPKRIAFFAISAILLGLSLLLSTTTATNISGGRIRYERVHPNGFVEVSNQPFPDSSFSSHATTGVQTGGWDGTTSLGKLTINLPIWSPESVGVTHAYIPVSIEGSSCPMVRTQILLNADNSARNRESEIIMLTTSLPRQTVRVGNLVPGTHYLYRIIARGCDETAATYERALETLPNPSPVHKIDTRKAPALTLDEIESEVAAQTALIKSVQNIFNTPTFDNASPENTTTSESFDNADIATLDEYEDNTPQDYTDYLENSLKKERSLHLPTTLRGWIAIILLTLGTIGIIIALAGNRKQGL